MSGNGGYGKSASIYNGSFNSKSEAINAEIGYIKEYLKSCKANPSLNQVINQIDEFQLQLKLQNQLSLF